MVDIYEVNAWGLVCLRGNRNLFDCCYPWGPVRNDKLEENDVRLVIFFHGPANCRVLGSCGRLRA